MVMYAVHQRAERSRFRVVFLIGHLIRHVIRSRIALGLECPDIFGKLAVMSPSVWWDNRSLLSLVNAIRSKPELKIWLDMGTGEGLRHLRDTDLLHRRLILRGWKDDVDLKYVRITGAVHDEEAWANRFDQVLRFLFPAK